MRKFASSMVGLVTESLKDDAMQIHTTANSSLPGNQNNPYAQQNYNNQGAWPQQPQHSLQPQHPPQQPYQQQPYQQQTYQQAPLSPPGLTPSPSSFSPTTYPASASPYANTPQYYAPQPNSGVSSNAAFLPPPLPPPVPVTNATVQRQAPGPAYYPQPVPVNQQLQPASRPVQVQQEEVYLPPPTAPPPHLIAELHGESAPPTSRAFQQQQQQQQQQPQYSHPQYGSYAPMSSPPNVAELSSQMNNLGVQNSTVSQPEPLSAASPPGPPPPIQELPAPIAPPSAPAPASEDRALLPPRGPPTVALSGEPNEIIPDCTEGREVSYPMDWYRLPGAPSHLICTRCYADHIQSTALAGAFEKVNQTGGTCCFWLPRIKDKLWEQALQSGDTQVLQAFFSESKDLQPCSGRVYNGPEESAAIKWYVVTEAGVLDGFLACQACYVYRIAGTSFESRFSPYDQSKLKDTQGIMCDACAPSIAANLRSMSANADWDTFVAVTAHRLSLPECTLVQPRTLDSDAVSYVLRQGGGGLRVCETCYVDKLVVKNFGSHFGRYQKPKLGFHSFLNDCIQETEGSCCLARMSLSVALDAAEYQRDFSVYKTAVEATSRVPNCTANGIQSSTWWTLQGGCDGLSICEACHAGFLVPTGVAQYFERTRRSSSSPILCSLHITAPRALDLLSHFGQMIERGLFSHFADYAKLWSGVRPCPGLKAQGGGTWYGYHELYMCKECYLECAISQPLADTLPVRDLYEEDLRICQMWSPRMRRLWLETNAAGAVGSPESKAAEDRLRELGTQRFQVYNATVLKIEVMQQMQAMKRQAALHKGVQSTVYAGANSFAMAAGATDGYMYGNSSLGWHGTKNGMIGAQLGRESQAELAQLSGGDETAEILRLQRIWSQVE
ncbi:unnamed protein product [Clonostachys rosea]|uniref:Integral membrane protein n=1 Tax=Bionectria ochroleuca TaxID=29856 RepID=A0ABY6U5W5_BIOOC|nr:unnamed protein product [Clonostachys rosea]